MIFVLYKASLYEQMTIDIDVTMARGHHLACEACEREEDLILEGIDTPWECEVDVERRKSRLKHSFVLAMPVKWAFYPVVVSIKDIWDCVRIRAVNPPAENMIDFVHADFLQLQVVPAAYNHHILVLVSGVIDSGS